MHLTFNLAGDVLNAKILKYNRKPPLTIHFVERIRLRAEACGFVQTSVI